MQALLALGSPPPLGQALVRELPRKGHLGSSSGGVGGNSWPFNKLRFSSPSGNNSVTVEKPVSPLTSEAAPALQVPPRSSAAAATPEAKRDGR